MSDTTRAVVVASIAAAATISVGILSALAAYYFASKRERRRALFSEAVKAATAWHELLWRVRRRQVDQEAELVSRFHDLQDDLSYYQAWVASDSLAMKRSYDKLVSGVKARTAELITLAWDEDIKSPGTSMSERDDPDLSDLIDTFMADVRSHLSPNPFRKWAVWRRNRG